MTHASILRHLARMRSAESPLGLLCRILRLPIFLAVFNLRLHTGSALADAFANNFALASTQQRLVTLAVAEANWATRSATNCRVMAATPTAALMIAYPAPRRFLTKAHRGKAFWQEITPHRDDLGG